MFKSDFSKLIQPAAMLLFAVALPFPAVAQSQDATADIFPATVHRVVFLGDSIT